MRLQVSSGVKHSGELTISSPVANFFITETVYAPRVRLPRHSHRRACFCLVLQGAYTERYRHKTIECLPSHLIFRPAAEPHSDHIGDGDVRCFIIEFETEWLARVRGRSARMDEPVSFRRHQLVWLATRLRGEARRADEFSSLAVEGLMLEMVAGVARESARISDDEHPRWLRRAREILHDNFAERMSLSVIAETVGVHPVYLATAFRRRFGCSVGEYV
ncbi:MAG: AraC family transcriptional regulator, partial [Acidobacteriota bacterium]|nr:AraC family transcriptional regulator [Acidobacteriota bacterium]